MPTPLPRPSPTDYQDAPGTELDLLWDQLCDVVEATEAKANAALPATPDAIGALLYGTIAFAPADIGWDYTKYPLSPQITVIGGHHRLGSAGITPEALFDLFSVARSAPTTTYYVDIATGSDSNNGLTSGTKFKSINKAITSGNATNSPYKVYVTAGTYYRSEGFTGTSSIQPTRDVAFVAVGGTVSCSPWDTYSSPSLDGTYTNCYPIAVTNVNRVLDLRDKRSNNGYGELLNVATAALCNQRPGTWASVGGTVYINRADGLAVTQNNTRLVRVGCSFLLNAAAAQSVYIGSDDGLGRWEFQGSDSVAAMRVTTTSAGGSDKAFVVKNTSFTHAGGFVSTTARCAQFDSYPGIVALYACAGSISATDVFNCKNTYSASLPPVFLTVNCYGCPTGSYPGTSCNCWTLHDNVIGMDIAGYYDGGAGGTIHNIGTSKAALVGTYVGNDRGDKFAGGSIEPTAIRAANTCSIDCYNTTVWQRVGGMGYHAADTSTIRLFNGCTWPVPYMGNVDASGN